MFIAYKKIATSILFIGLLAIVVMTPTAVLADQYGEQPNTQISLNKMVQDPATGNFVDNLGTDNTRFQAGQDVTYRISITNNGNTSFGFVDVTDTLPSFLDFVSGPGNFDSNNRQITFRLENLTPGKNETRDIHARVVASDRLPSNKGVFCITNAASLKTNDGRTTSDTAQLCIGNQVLGAKAPIKQLPATGFPETSLAIGFLALIGAGFFLRKATY